MRFFNPSTLASLTVCIVSLVSAQSDKVVIGYFTDWALDSYPVSKVDFSKVTHINYSFAIFDDKTWDPKIQTDATLKELVSLAHAKSTKVSISIGGWTGSKYFSPMVANKEKRTTFIKNTVNFVNKYGLDGVDLDWEFPGRLGEETNIIDKNNDTKNYLELLKELRQALGNKLITAAVRVQPFDGPNGPLNNVGEFSKYFDWINLMTYDINGSWSKTTGPLGALDNQPNKGDPFSIKQAVNDWNKAGFSKDKMVVGIPFYGYTLKPTTDMTNSDQYSPFTGPGKTLAYNILIKENMLKSPTEANTSEGWLRKYDTISQTPWLFNKAKEMFIAYDDVQSIKAKTDYARCNGLRGAFTWAMDNDYEHQLLTALNNVLSNESCDGKPTPPSDKCINGQRKCKGEKDPLYYKCENEKWKLYTCGTDKVCSPNGLTDTVCKDPNATPTTPPTPPPSDKCINGQRKCKGEKDPLYYKCENEKWKLYTCDTDKVCSPNGLTDTVCKDPNVTPTTPPTPPPSDKCINGQRKCKGEKDPLYYKCENEKWKLYTCDSTDICTPNGTTNIVCKNPNTIPTSQPTTPPTTPTSTPPPSNDQCINGQRKCKGEKDPLYYKCENNKWKLYTCDSTDICTPNGTTNILCKKN